MVRPSGGRRRSVPERLKRSRVHTPGCPWDYTENCAAALVELKAVDIDAYEVLVALILDAIQDGLDEDDNGGNLYTVPVGAKVDQQRHFSRKPMPWLGELKAEATETHKRGFVDYRLYFLETMSHTSGTTDLILGASLPADGKGVAGDYDDAAQTDDMRDAMWKGIHWCEECQPPRTWRTWA